MRLAALLLTLAVGCSGSVDEPATEPATDTGSPASEAAIAIDSGVAELDAALVADTGVAPEDASPADTYSPPVDAGPSSTRHVARPLGSTDAPRGFYEYLPPGYTKDAAKSPLLLFFHGIDQNGNGTTQLKDILVAGPPMLIEKNLWPASRPFVVLSSQNASGCPSAAGIKAFLDWALAHYNIDPARIYLTGLSCGAIGTWDYLRANVATTPVAAVVPIAGNGRGAWDTNKCALGRVAIWAFHGDADTRVTPDGTTYPMTNLIACPAPPRRDATMTFYPGVGHDSLSRTYNLSAGHDIYKWLLDNHL